MRPHAKLDRPRSRAQVRRIALGLTLAQAVELSGGRVGRAQWCRMETTGSGSLRAWQVVAEILGLDVEILRELRLTEEDDPRQLTLEGVQR